jgi:hypothetical protein
VTGLIDAEQALVNGVSEHLSSASTGGGGIRHEVRELINLDGFLARDLTRLANQGLSADAVFQQDLTNLVSLESELTQILTQLNPPNG